MEDIKMDKIQVKKQLELLSNNTETLEIPKNYLKGVKEGISAITAIVYQIEEKTDYALKGIDLAKEGFITVTNDIAEIINAEK